MSFGKRTREPSGYHEPMTSNPDIAAVINREPRKGHGNFGKAAGPIAMLAGGVVLVVAAMYALNTIVMNMLFGGALNPPPKIVDTGLHAKVAAMCPDSKPVGPGPEIEAAMMGLTRPARSADFLNCAMSKYRERLCEEDSRQQLARDLSTYFAYHERKKEQFDRLMADPRSQQMARMFQMMNNAKDGAGIAAGNLEGVAQSVILNMQQLIRDGYLSAADFGWLPPSHVKPHLEGVQQEKEPCK